MNSRPRTLGTCILDFKLLVGWALRGSNVEKGTNMPCRGTLHQEISKGGSDGPLFSKATTQPSLPPLEEPDSTIAGGKGVVHCQHSVPRTRSTPLQGHPVLQLHFRCGMGFWGVMLGVIWRALSAHSWVPPQESKWQQLQPQPGFLLPYPSGCLTTLTSLQSFALSPPRMGAWLCIGL